MARSSAHSLVCLLKYFAVDQIDVGAPRTGLYHSRARRCPLRLPPRGFPFHGVIEGNGAHDVPLGTESASGIGVPLVLCVEFLWRKDVTFAADSGDNEISGIRCIRRFLVVSNHCPHKLDSARNFNALRVCAGRSFFFGTGAPRQNSTRRAAPVDAIRRTGQESEADLLRQRLAHSTTSRDVSVTGTLFVHWWPAWQADGRQTGRKQSLNRALSAGSATSARRPRLGQNA